MTTPLPQPAPAWLETVRRHVQSLQFGSVQITVHQGAVVQVERVEKIRIEPEALAPSTARPVERS